MSFNKNVFIFVALIGILLIAGCTKIKGGKTVVELPKFSSCNEIANAFKSASSSYDYGIMYESTSIKSSISSPMPMAAPTSGSDSASKPSYSTTNVQVQGVDEADIVKTDGKYIYTISNGKLHIAEAYPADTAKVLSSTKLTNMSPNEIFIDGNKVLVFGTQGGGYYDFSEVGYPYYNYKSFTNIQIFDVTDRANPKLERSIDFEGSYVSSRMINSTVYFVINDQPNYYYYGPEEKDNETIVPLYRDSAVSKELSPVAKCGDIGRLEPLDARSFVIVGSLSMKDVNADITKEVIVASGENIYASQNNLYLAELKYDYVYPEATTPVDVILPRRPVRSAEETVIHKFALDNGEISYLGKMEAPGSILNQFSMDEHKEHFRIATTKGHVARGGGDSTNNVYIFDDQLKMSGKLEDLAPGEKIYSVRFMGDKGYLVTFKKVDPLFVIDLSNPKNPKVLGKLKIPGYSDYLHPIDENHIIGIGKETVEAEEGDFAWYQGIKMAVFDVSDVENPKEMYKTVIGDRGTESYALQDHKAFLYDKSKNLLVIPVLLAEIPSEEKFNRDKRGSSPKYGDYVFQGAYVYDLTLENGFQLRGTITHVDGNESFKKSGYYYRGYGDEVKRSLYIGDYLYTISDNKILANALSDLALVKELKLN